MASDSDLEAYLNQLSRKSHNLQKQNINSESPSLSNSSATPTFGDDDDDDDDVLHSRKVSSKQKFQKKKVETVPGSLLDIKSLSDKYSKRKPEIAKKDTNISSVEEESFSYDNERVYNGRLNKDKVNVKEYIKHHAVSKQPRSKVIDVDSSMDEELAKYLNETSLHDEDHDIKVYKSPQYDIKSHSSLNSSSSGSPLLNINNLHTLDDILGTRSNDNSESVNINHNHIKSNQKEDLNIIKNKSFSKRESIQISTQQSSESVVDKDGKGSLLRNLNSTSIFYSKGQSDNSSFNNKIQSISPQKSNQKSKQNKEITTTEGESVSVIEENENFVEESITESDILIEEDTKSKNVSEIDDTINSNVNETVSESSESGKYSYIEKEFENGDSSSSNDNILENSNTSEERRNRKKNKSLSNLSKKKLSKASEIGVNSIEENSDVKIIGHHMTSSSKKKSIRTESKAHKNKKSESIQRDSSEQSRRSRHRNKKRYTRSRSSSSDSDFSADSSSSLSDSELLNLSKKIYQKLKNKTHSSYCKRKARKFPEWNYPTYTPSVYGMVYPPVPPTISGVGINNFGVLNHSTIMRQQVELTRMFMDSQRTLYSAYTSALHSSQHFTTIKDTEKYIKKRRKPTLTFEEALKLVKEEKRSH